MRGMVTIPSTLAETQRAEGGAWVRNLPSLVADIMDRWSLRLDGPVGHGMAGLVLPVVRPDGLPAVLKLQPVTEENADVAAGLRTWAGRGKVLQNALWDLEDGEPALDPVQRTIAQTLACPTPGTRVSNTGDR